MLNGTMSQWTKIPSLLVIDRIDSAGGSGIREPSLVRNVPAWVVWTSPLLLHEALRMITVLVVSIHCYLYA